MLWTVFSFWKPKVNDVPSKTVFLAKLSETPIYVSIRVINTEMDVLIGPTPNAIFLTNRGRQL